MYVSCVVIRSSSSFLCFVFQSFLIDRAGRKRLMGYGYLMMGITMSVLTVTLSIKVSKFTSSLYLPVFCLVEESFNKIFCFHTGSESIDPIREHRPDFLCHLYLWTWTLWVFCYFSTSKHKNHSYLLFIDCFLYFIWIVLISFQLECLCLFLLTSSYKHGVLLRMLSVGLSTGSACSVWGCSSAT